MRVAVKPVVTTSVALAGASILAVAPLQQPVPADTRVIEQDVSLAASSLAYVPINAIEQSLSAPANAVAALDRLATALEFSGSWNERQPNNVWGWDPANPAMLRESVNLLIPFPSFSEPFGTHLNWWTAANLPMYAGCTYECPDLPGMLARMFRVPISDFYDEDGYTFPTVINPVDGQETEWSGQQVILDPAEPFRSVWDSLTAEPTGIQTVTWYEAVTALANFGAALQTTGHLPDWIAVREMEQFVKLFLHAPDEVAPSVTDMQVPSPSEAAASWVGSTDFAAGGLSPATALPELESGPQRLADLPEDGDGPSFDPASAPTPIVDKIADELKEKFDSATEDVTEDTTEAPTDADGAEDLEDPNSASAVQETTDEDETTDQDDEVDDDEALDQEESADQDTDETDTSTSRGGKHRKADDSADSGSPQDKTDPSNSSSDSGSSDSGASDSGDGGSGDSSD